MIGASSAVTSLTERYWYYRKANKRLAVLNAGARFLNDGSMLVIRQAMDEESRRVQSDPVFRRTDA